MELEEKKLSDSEIYEKFIRNSDFSEVTLEGRYCPDCINEDIDEKDYRSEEDEK